MFTRLFPGIFCELGHHYNNLVVEPDLMVDRIPAWMHE